MCQGLQNRAGNNIKRAMISMAVLAATIVMQAAPGRAQTNLTMLGGATSVSFKVQEDMCR